MSRAAVLGLVLVLALGSATGAAAETVTLDQYVSALESIATDLRRGDDDAAAATARQLVGDTVDGQGVAFAADPTVLAPIAGGQPPPEAEARVRALLRSLGAAQPAAPAPDAALLDRLRAQQALPELPEGGTLPALEWRELRFDGLDDALERAWRRIEELLGRLLRWLLGLPRGGGGMGSPRIILYAAAALVAGVVVALGVMALRGALRRRVKAPDRTPDVVPDAGRDEDPLSRTASDWERRAAELAATRPREAVRAWYHAVLVTLFAEGLLHHRRSRTNWEYVAALAAWPSLRAPFATLTREFERTWYGLSAPTPEAAHEFGRAARALLVESRTARDGRAA